MQTLREIYLIETLARVEAGRHRRTRAPGDEGPRRGQVAARLAGRAQTGTGARLLSYAGQQSRSYRVPHPPGGLA